MLRRNTLAESRRLLDAIHAGKVPKPDLVAVAGERDHRRRAGPAGRPARRELRRPALIGALYVLPDRHLQNSVIVWDPRTGPGQRYAKQQLVPFGEYVPARKLAALVTPFVDQETVDMVPGDGTNQALAVAGTKVGVFVCYEAAFDYPARDAVRDGRRAARGADQQRLVRRERDERAAAGHVAAAGGRARPRRSWCPPSRE